MRRTRTNSISVLVVMVFLFGTVSSFAQVGIFDDNVDIGDVGAPGSSDFRNSEYELSGSGAGIGDATDNFHFLYKEMSGPFILSSAWVDVNPYESGSQEVKAALMVRDSLDTGAVHFDMFVRNDGQVDTEWRETTDGPLDRTSNYHWRHELIPFEVQDGIQIVRLGNTLMSYYIDYETGQPVLHETRQMENLSDPVYVGLAVTSNEWDHLSFGYFSNVKLTEIPFFAQRTVPQIIYTGGTSITGIKITIDGLVDPTTTATVEESIPAGVTVDTIQTTVGSAAVSGDKIVWNIGNETGSAEMTYDLVIPKPGAPLICILSGSVTKGSETVNLKNMTLKHAIGLGPDWKIGANGIWAVVDGVLKHYADTGLDPKHIWIEKDFGQDYTIRADVMMTSWTDDDLSRSGVMIRCNPEADSNGSREMALNLMFHDDLNSVDMLNDHIEWTSRSDYAWEMNQWYTMTLTGEGTLVTGTIVKKGSDDVFELAPWDKPSNSERVGYPGLAGSTQIGLTSQFDNVEIIVGGEVVFSDQFDEITGVADWSVY